MSAEMSGMKRLAMSMAFASGAGLLMASAMVFAAQPVPLPDFELITLEGTAVRSHSGLSNSRKWLIVYVQANCRPCETLLRMVKQEEHPALPAKLVIIVGGVEGAEVARMRDKLPDLSNAHWYADPSRKAWVALKMAGVPMVFGLRVETIEWTLSGVLPSDLQMKSILSSWAEE